MNTLTGCSIICVKKGNKRLRQHETVQKKLAQYTWRGEKVEDIFFTMLMNYKDVLMTRFVDLYNKYRAIKAESLNTYNMYENVNTSTT